jgi:hypothetical protein
LRFRHQETAIEPVQALLARVARSSRMAFLKAIKLERAFSNSRLARANPK